VTTDGRLSTVRWAVVELWDDLHYPHRSLAFRRFLCALGFHWPITFWASRGGDYTPPEYNWACENCGRERLPYRAWMWRVPLLRRWVR
jgi:hypothetical protein